MNIFYIDNKTHLGEHGEDAFHFWYVDGEAGEGVQPRLEGTGAGNTVSLQHPRAPCAVPRRQQRADICVVTETRKKCRVKPGSSK